MANITVNKLDAARRELETAALLYFNDRDIVSVHTLASAAHEIVETIAEKRGRSSLIQRSLLNFFSEDLVREIRKAMRTPQNFFKHADRDADEQVDLDSDFTEILLLDAMATYAQITGEIPSIFNAFSTWYSLRKPQILVHTPDAQRMLREAKSAFGSMTRLEFLKKYLSNAVNIRP